MLEEVEAEFNYRKKIDPFWMTFITVVSVLFIGYHMVTAGIGLPEIFKHRTVHLGFLLCLTWLYFPARKGSPRGRPSTLDLDPVRVLRDGGRAHGDQPRLLPHARRDHELERLHPRLGHHGPGPGGHPADRGRTDALDQHHLRPLYVGRPLDAGRLLPPGLSRSSRIIQASLPGRARAFSACPWGFLPPT
ncbi:MAG: hypothetical protein M0C28_30210 [Candidatus Moduliflexus flocculans]|nr:hypothetical protein [Candidatus Moduliflexus flocculans]